MCKVKPCTFIWRHNHKNKNPFPVKGKDFVTPIHKKGDLSLTIAGRSLG